MSQTAVMDQPNQPIEIAPGPNVSDRVDDRALFGLSSLPRGGELLLVVVVSFYFVVYSTGFVLPTWSPRYGLLLASLPIGLVGLWSLVVRRDRAALAASLFLCWCVLSAIVSPAPLVAIKGALGAHSFVIMFAAVVGLWAIGRSLSVPAREALPIAVLVGVAANIVLGVVQIVFEIDSGPLGAVGGRAAGFMGNAAYYGSATVGAAAYCAARVLKGASTRWTVALVVFAFGTAISGSRSSTGALVIVTVGLCLAYRSRRILVAVAAIIVGNVCSALVSLSSPRPAVGRLVTTGSSGRSQIWEYDLQAFSQRPVFGWGLGNHAAAIRQFFTEEFTRTSAWDDRTLSWNDPHNIVLMLLVATGVVGVALMGWFAVSCVAHVDDGALLAMAGAAALTWLLQPASIESLPVAMLALGAAAPRLEPNAERYAMPSGSRSLAVGALVTGAVLGAAFLVPDVRLRRALDANDAQASKDALGWVWEDPVATDAVARLFTNRGLEEPAYRETALSLSKRTTEIDRFHPYFLTELARRQFEFGHYDEGFESMQRALELEPWSPSAWQLRVLYAVAVGDEAMADESRAVVCRLDLPDCPTGSRWVPPEPNS